MAIVQSKNQAWQLRPGLVSPAIIEQAIVCCGQCVRSGGHRLFVGQKQSDGFLIRTVRFVFAFKCSEGVRVSRTFNTHYVSDLLYACSIEQSILTILVAVYFSVYQFDVDVVLGQLCTIGSMCDRRSIVTTPETRQTKVHPESNVTTRNRT